MEKINWGIIGCGDVTEVKSGPAFSNIVGSNLVAVMRRDALKAHDYAQRHKVPKWYTNVDELINDHEVNAIYIATPPNAHAELAIKAIKAGKPVYVEKPMALNYKECELMIKASEKHKVPLYVAYYRRALPGFVKVKQLIDAGKIGKIKVVNAVLHKSLLPDNNKALPWRVNPKIAGGGHFFDLASHQLDFFNFLFGTPHKVKSFALNQTQQYEAEDMVSACILMSNDIVVNGSWCFTVPEFLQQDTIEIFGEKGMIRISCFDFVPVELITSSGKEIFDYKKPMHVQQPFIEHVVGQLLGKTEQSSNAVSASLTNWIMDEAVKEYYKQ